MSFLLGKYRLVGLSVEEKTELAKLISIEINCKNIEYNKISFENMIDFGLLAVGIHFVFEKYETSMKSIREQLCNSALKDLDRIDMNIQLEKMGFFR